MNIFVSECQSKNCRFCYFKNIATETLPEDQSIQWCVSCKDKAYNYLFRCGMNSTRGIPYKQNGYIMRHLHCSYSTDIIIHHTISPSLYFRTSSAIQLNRICIKSKKANGNYWWDGDVSVEDFCKWNDLDYQETCTNMQNYFRDHVVGSLTKPALREPVKLIEPFESVESMLPTEEKPDLLYHAQESTEYISHINSEIVPEPIEDQSNDKPIIEKQIFLPFLDIDFSDLCNLE
jgi:hypothetical protein